ncbi:MAG: single-stranded DNA-binding protein [Actinomycetota bacterium]
MTTIQLYGRLYRGPEERTTGAGKPMVTSAMVVDLGRGEEQPEWFSLVSFGRISEVLAKHVKGDMVAVGGRLSKSTWKAQDGTAHTGFSVLMESRVLARCARERRRSSAMIRRRRGLTMQSRSEVKT